MAGIWSGTSLCPPSATMTKQATDWLISSALPCVLRGLCG
jgi:hypothetical protein